MISFSHILAKKAMIWTSAKSEPPALPPTQWCETKDVLRARIDSLTIRLLHRNMEEDRVRLFDAVLSEIGSNSFDHNIGNWPDVLGSFFSYDLSKRIVVLADRGQGVLATLRRVKPELVDDEEALRAAFTLILTARAPEHRGNGLKFVRAMVTDFDLKLTFQSGTAELHLKKGDRELIIKKADRPIRGCLVLIKF